MELIIICSKFVKMFMVFLLTYFVYIKSTSYKDNNNYKNVFIILCSINISIIYTILMPYFPTIITVLILYIIYGLIMSFTIKSKQTNFNIIAYVFSYMIAYAIYLISIALSGIILVPILSKSEFTNPISLVIIPCIAYLMYHLIFKLKRFRNGFNFLKEKRNYENIRKFAILFICIIIVIIFCFPRGLNVFVIEVSLFLSSICIILSLIIWIKTQITNTYKSKMRDRTIEIQKTEIDEKTRVIEEIKAENLKLATAIHKYNHKFSSLEHAMKNALSLDSKTEFANELSVILKEVKETSDSFAKEVKTNINKLPSTNITGIDNMFKYMQEEANKNNIKLDLIINESINSLIEKIISKEKFEILIGDHLKDAIIAVNSSEASYKSILVTLGLVENYYELSIYDTGIEFEIETLLKLGEEQVTTHANTGGSGIGFMTTFETLKECKASLVIEEYNPETTNYTKSVTIKFDGRNEYKIISYRAEKIKENIKERRIIIEKLK